LKKEPQEWGKDAIEERGGKKETKNEALGKPGCARQKTIRCSSIEESSQGQREKGKKTTF